jgi:hypothetical protein
MLHNVATELLDVWAIAHLAGRSHIPSPHHLNVEGKKICKNSFSAPF